jgi:hypothetical protein
MAGVSKDGHSGIADCPMLAGRAKQASNIDRRAERMFLDEVAARFDHVAH